MKSEINNIPTCSQSVSNNKFIHTSEKLNLPYNNEINFLNSTDNLKSDDLNVNINLLHNAALKMSVKCYGKPNFSRKQVVELQFDITELITKSIAKEIETKVLSNCTDSKIINLLKTISDFCKNPFKDIDTEYKFLKYLQHNKECYEKPKIITLNNTIENVILNNMSSVDEKKIKGVILLLQVQFQKYFELPGVLDSFLTNHNSINTTKGSYNNFINGELWQQKVLLHPRKIIISYFLYFDDFEINNPLGSHSYSVLGYLLLFSVSSFLLAFKLKKYFCSSPF